MRSLVALVAFSACAAPLVSQKSESAPVSFIEDDYPRALAQAQKDKRPIFVDMWAPWCHTCRFVRELVLSDRALGKQSARFVWLAVDVDKDVNAPFVSQFPLRTLPTFLVVDGATEKVAATRSAALDLPQLLALLDEGERAIAHVGAGEAELAFAEGEREMGAGKLKEAQGAFERALAAGGDAWARRHNAVEELVLARTLSGDSRACVELVERETQSGERDAWWANLITAGLSCAEEGGPPAGVLLERAREAVAIQKLGVDDRSSLYEELVSLAPEPEKAALAQKWWAFLDGERAHAKTAAERALYDPHRLLAAIALGDPARMVPELSASERDLPGDYNGAARLALAYEAMGRYDDALLASERALKLVYGPRRLRVEEVRARIYRKKGDRAGARRVLEAALVTGKALPSSPRATAAVAHLDQLLRALVTENGGE